MDKICLKDEKWDVTSMQDCLLMFYIFNILSMEIDHG